MKRLKTVKNKKGFTLIEIIVVLIILAIMAAIAVPSMIGFVNDSREQAILSEARVGLIAAQTIATKHGYTNDPADAVAGGAAAVAEELTNAKLTETNSEFQKLIQGVKGAFSDVKIHTDGNVKSITYVKGSNSMTYTLNVGTGEGKWEKTPED